MFIEPASLAGVSRGELLRASGLGVGRLRLEYLLARGEARAADAPNDDPAQSVAPRARAVIMLMQNAAARARWILS